MNKYQSYKPSGVEWIGEIPENWGLSKIKWICNTNTVQINQEKLNELDLVHYSIPNVQEFGTGQIENGSDIDSSKLIVKGGEILFSKLNPRKGTTCIVDKHDDLLTVCSGEFIVMVPKSDNTKYIHYCVSIKSFIVFIDSLVESVTRSHQRVRPDSFLSLMLPIPPISEQHQIVQYLDEKTELIDKLISTKERKITLLKEQRISLINQVVTKGLNPNVKMTDSGVEWIGEIPEHWVVTKFNRYVFFQEGPGLRTFQFTDEGTKVICVTNITENGIDFSYKKFISNEEYLEKYQHFTVQKGDLLLSSSGNSWGKVSEYLEDEKVMLNTSTIRLNTLDSKRMNKTLIKYILKSEFVRTQLDILMTGSCQPNFGPSHLNQLIITVPPIEEQIEIISNIEKYDFEFQKLIHLEQKKIDLLKEYRQSLISEVVTGKIKVTTDE
jgi:type I restriction enzyme S subunit